MNKHIKNPSPLDSNTGENVMALSFFARELGVSKAEARMIHSKMHTSPWLDPPVLCTTAGHVAEAEDGIHKYGYYIE